MPNIPHNSCCGCTACYSVCPCSAIKMSYDAEGFAYPRVDTDKCVECGKCEQACPLLHPPRLFEEYACTAVAQSRDLEVLDECSSGGFMDALCEYVIKQLGGYVSGVAFDGDFMPVHIICDSYEEAKALRNSKYAQSELGDTFIKIKKLLSERRYVLFIGTPCQVAGLKSFLADDYENLLTADLVCRSVPSRELWRKYLDWQKERHRSGIKRIACRKKTYGYHSGTLEIEFENGKRYSQSNRTDYYMKSFHADICSRPSCYDCRFKTEHRCSDFTVFDCWRPEAVANTALTDNDLGYSNVIAHTERAERILRSMNNIDLTDADAEKMFAFTGGMHSRSIEKKEARREFYRDVDALGYHGALRAHVTVSLLDRLIEKAKPVLYFKKKRR